ncbi:MAG: flagellar biosynthesis anti-sigma factor FlgM [Deltaproteobacteria bacterium]|nr:flagellar biosynthesis anti-sigma factor FlgM [Deltaproteobacteria bacterium]
MSNKKKNRPGGRSNSNSGETSEEGKEHLEGLIHLAQEVVYQTPEVRPDKVARLKEAIEQGTYEIDSEKVADTIIEEVLGKR